MGEGEEEEEKEIYLFLWLFFLLITNIFEQSIQVACSNIRQFLKLFDVYTKIKYQYQRRNKNADK